MFSKSFGISVLGFLDQNVGETKVINKLFEIWFMFLSLFGPALGTFLGPFRGQHQVKKSPKNGTSFGTRLPWLRGVRELPKQEIKERGEKGKAAGNISSKRKGCISFRLPIRFKFQFEFQFEFQSASNSNSNSNLDSKSNSI